MTVNTHEGLQLPDELVWLPWAARCRVAGCSVRCSPNPAVYDLLPLAVASVFYLVTELRAKRLRRAARAG